MTIEEAIARLEEHTQYCVPVDDLPAFEMAVDALYAQQEVEKNEPLTLEELREMDGEPVWIERIGGKVPYDKGYAFVSCENCLCRTMDGCNAFFELYGISWLAYRRKPEEEVI